MNLYPITQILLLLFTQFTQNTMGVADFVNNEIHDLLQNEIIRPSRNTTTVPSGWWIRKVGLNRVLVSN